MRPKERRQGVRSTQRWTPSAPHLTMGAVHELEGILAMHREIPAYRPCSEDEAEVSAGEEGGRLASINGDDELADEKNDDCGGGEKAVVVATADADHVLTRDPQDSASIINDVGFGDDYGGEEAVAADEDDVLRDEEAEAPLDAAEMAEELKRAKNRELYEEYQRINGIYKMKGIKRWFYAWKFKDDEPETKIELSEGINKILKNDRLRFVVEWKNCPKEENFNEEALDTIVDDENFVPILMEFLEKRYGEERETGWIRKKKRPTFMEIEQQTHEFLKNTRPMSEREKRQMKEQKEEEKKEEEEMKKAREKAKRAAEIERGRREDAESEERRREETGRREKLKKKQQQRREEVETEKEKKMRGPKRAVDGEHRAVAKVTPRRLFTTVTKPREEKDDGSKNKKKKEEEVPPKQMVIKTEIKKELVEGGHGDAAQTRNQLPTKKAEGRDGGRTKQTKEEWKIAKLLAVKKEIKEEVEEGDEQVVATTRSPTAKQKEALERVEAAARVWLKRPAIKQEVKEEVDDEQPPHKQQQPGQKCAEQMAREWAEFTEQYGGKFDYIEHLTDVIPLAVHFTDEDRTEVDMQVAAVSDEFRRKVERGEKITEMFRVEWKGTVAQVIIIPLANFEVAFPHTTILDPIKEEQME